MMDAHTSHNTTTSTIRYHNNDPQSVKQLREQVRGLQKEYNKTEDDLKALQVSQSVCLFMLIDWLVD